MPDASTRSLDYAVHHRRLRVDRSRSATTVFYVVDLEPAPAPLPAEPPRPCGDLAAATIEEVVAAYRRCGPDRDSSVWARTSRGVRLILRHLSTFPGETWQHRWEAAELDKDHGHLGEVVAPGDRRVHKDVIAGIRILFCMRVIRPTLVGFRSNQFTSYAKCFRTLQRDPLLDRLFVEVEARTDLPRRHQGNALFDICCALTIQGISLADLTPAALLYYANETCRYGTSIASRGDRGRYSGAVAWQVLRDMGHFPPSTPPLLHKAIQQGQLSTEELVDRYGVRNGHVRQLLVDYLDYRRADTDYSTLLPLARNLAGLFWAAIESINPSQDTLKIDQSTYEQWREGINWLKPATGRPPRPRRDPYSILMVVRAFYADIQSWAVQDPMTWARWAAPCPVPDRDVRKYNKHRRRIKERTDHRIRMRQPLLPALVEHVETQYERARELLAAGAAASPTLDTAARFIHRDRAYERFVTRHDFLSPDHIAVRLRDCATGEVSNQTIHEDYCFWRWAAVEVLRLSGIRIEELCELSHLSIRQYKRPNGEVIGLLVIAPSKTDRERVVPMSAELFHVIAQVLRRLTANGAAIDVIARYDTNEKTWTEPMPFLFQRRHGYVNKVIAPGTVQQWLRVACTELGETHPAFKDLTFTPHDFRRLFATDLANSGLPVHIGAALLGHLNLETFRGYVTVFDEDVVRHYQSHLEKRRTLRPAEEYRQVTAEEWNGFEEHFNKRKVELGGCARPYGTGCQHEHACIRCPMLAINPKMLARLTEIEDDLIARRERAEREAWLGEIEGIDLTLSFLRQKRSETERLARLAPTGPALLVLAPPPPRAAGTGRRPDSAGD
ncbi:tyrosine-type recombinase/integrase [Nocardia wallacei]|uniref:tyrosine-type recombinase/integrase n=1 Tax=Nocardia wallacei TaxID=480035 RepID=UPI002458EB79|nr:tyrosine-type recombinase/integrase [Nocardia wallacei]